MKIETLIKKNEINGSELEHMIDLRKKNKLDFVLIDVREEYEFNNKHIVGVDKLVPMSELSKKVNELESFKQKLIISQCKSGGRSAQAQMFLKRLGFEKVLNLSGGILKYRGQTS
tara:strand:- start:713 stop:1057 length:345 start_codon:yes stop_codon:yes gene_type:complete